VRALPRARSGISIMTREEFARRPEFGMTSLSFGDVMKMKEEGPSARRWDGAPDRLDGRFPFRMRRVPTLPKSSKILRQRKARPSSKQLGDSTARIASSFGCSMATLKETA
jgi:hypothetical protein